MLFLALLPTAGSTFLFEGGDEIALARNLSTHLSAPVCVMYGGAASKLSRVAISYESKSELARSLAGRIRGSVTSAAEGIAPKAWPKGLFFKSRVASDYNAVVPKGKLTLQEDLNDTVTLETSNGGITLEEICAKLPQLDLSWNGFFDEARFAIFAKRVSVKRLLETVSAAIGSNVATSGSRFRLNLDPKAFRARTIAMCAVPSSERVMQLRVREDSDLSYLSQLVTRLSDKQIMKFYDGWDGVVAFTPGNPVHTAAMRRAEALIVANTPSEELQVSGADIPALINNISRRDRVRGRLRPDGTVECHYMLRNGSWLVM